MAFAWMDLLDHGQPGLANGLLSDWLDASGDTTAPDVLPFFAVYRALVRAKVAVIRSTQAGADAASFAERGAWLHRTGPAHRPPPAPQLVITHGLSGSGKTWASSRWLQAETSGRAIRLRSDVERKRLHGLSATQASGSGLNTGLYSPQAHTDTYAHLLERARHLLQARLVGAGGRGLSAPPRARGLRRAGAGTRTARSTSWPPKRRWPCCASASPRARRMAATRPRPRWRCWNSSWAGWSRWTRPSARGACPDAGLTRITKNFNPRCPAFTSHFPGAPLPCGRQPIPTTLETP